MSVGKGTHSDTSETIPTLVEDSVVLYRNYEVIEGEPFRTDTLAPTTHRCMSCFSKNRSYCFFQSDWRERVPKFDIDLPKAEIRWRSRT